MILCVSFCLSLSSVPPSGILWVHMNQSLPHLLLFILSGSWQQFSCFDIEYHLDLIIKERLSWTLSMCFFLLWETRLSLAPTKIAPKKHPSLEKRVKHEVKDVCCAWLLLFIIFCVLLMSVVYSFLANYLLVEGMMITWTASGSCFFSQKCI